MGNRINPQPFTMLRVCEALTRDVTSLEGDLAKASDIPSCQVVAVKLDLLSRRLSALEEVALKSNAIGLKSLADAIVKLKEKIYGLYGASDTRRTAILILVLAGSTVQTQNLIQNRDLSALANRVSQLRGCIEKLIAKYGLTLPHLMILKQVNRAAEQIAALQGAPLPEAVIDENGEIDPQLAELLFELYDIAELFYAGKQNVAKRKMVDLPPEVKRQISEKQTELAEMMETDAENDELTPYATLAYAFERTRPSDPWLQLLEYLEESEHLNQQEEHDESANS